jgi:hypothetical protein
MVVTDNCKRVKGVWLCFGGGGCVSYIRKVYVRKDVFSLSVQFICWIRESWVCIRFISQEFELNMNRV